MNKNHKKKLNKKIRKNLLNFLKSFYNKTIETLILSQIKKLNVK